MDQLQRAKIVITNFHAFIRREQISTSRLTKAILEQDDKEGIFLESSDQMVRRVYVVS